MKALQITGANTYTILEHEIPVPFDDQVLVEIRLVSTCPRWDMNMLAGRNMFNYNESPNYPLPPGFPGHELAGVVKSVGKSVRTLNVGDRVAALEHLDGNGAYAQYLCFREEELIKLPDHISDKQAVSLELLKCVVIGIMQFGDLRGKSIVVSGLGPAGMLAIQVARLWGASRVIGVDINETRVRQVRELGLGETCLVDELQGQQFDLGYDCVGAAASVQNLIEYVDEHIVIFGVLRGEVKYPEHLWYKGMKLESYKYRNVGPRDHELLIDLVGNKKLNMECLQTHHYTFDRYQEAVDLLNKQEAIKVYFYPQTDFDI
ncbi:zinc-binding dehydrogenase [Paenibacillus sp. 2TAB26]|uniref:zinc-dependent alcohol dehydrogenase n=1 Tax=Paenibacillus sp. 2TAB26 TaxID=3233005 RepID=UPI003F9946FC